MRPPEGLQRARKGAAEAGRRAAAGEPSTRRGAKKAPALWGKVQALFEKSCSAFWEKRQRFLLSARRPWQMCAAAEESLRGVIAHAAPQLGDVDAALGVEPEHRELLSAVAQTIEEAAVAAGEAGIYGIGDALHVGRVAQNLKSAALRGAGQAAKPEGDVAKRAVGAEDFQKAAVVAVGSAVLIYIIGDFYKLNP